MAFRQPLIARISQAQDAFGDLDLAFLKKPKIMRTSIGKGGCKNL